MKRVIFVCGPCLLAFTALYFPGISRQVVGASPFIYAVPNRSRTLAKFLKLGSLDPTRPAWTKTRRRHRVRSLRLPFMMDSSSNNVGLSATADFQESYRRIRHSSTAFLLPGRCSILTDVDQTCTRLSEAVLGAWHADLDACGDSTGSDVEKRLNNTPHESGSCSGRQK